VGRLADARRAAKPPIGDGPTGARKVLQRTIAKTLEPEKENRYPSGAELAAALDGASAHRAAEREFPKRGLLTRSMQRAALVWLMVLVAIPQFISSAVNIAYNMSEIGKKLDDDQWSLFWNGLVPGYNVVVYPLLLGLGLLVTLPVFRVWSEVRGTERADPERVQEARRRALRLPLWLLMLVAAGWLPGGLLFPLLIDWLQGPIGWNIYAHFVTSFTLSGLIAAAYSFAGLQFLVLRVMYPGLWVDATDFRNVARQELASSLWRIRFIPTLSYSIPVVAVLLIGAASLADTVISEREGIEPSLLMICCCLNLLGLVGVVVVGAAARSMSRTVVALTGRQA
ncbi:MAG: hypothetical protein AAF596_08095, partial [Planctomycetota bacterium]